MVGIELGLVRTLLGIVARVVLRSMRIVGIENAGEFSVVVLRMRNGRQSNGKETIRVGSAAMVGTTYSSSSLSVSASWSAGLSSVLPCMCTGWK